uniref:Polyprotein n=1 Tax=Cajanus cajan TaxID=3821 RepID=A0A151TUH2_CAJCA|nr:polyprotein [Cajanus cajan]
MVSLPYEKDFTDRQIPTKARPIQMSHELVNHCQKEIKDLLSKGLIRKSKSPWSCAAFYVNKASEIERGAPRLVINYKPLNQALQWIRYPIPNKKDLLARLHSAKIFSKFDMKSRFWQIQINPSDRYKTTFIVPFGQYEWNVMPFGLKNAPSEFQNIMNDIFNPYSNFCIVYIDDVLIFSTSIDQHFKHLEIFFNVIKRNSLAVSKTKICLFQTKIKFLGHIIFQGTIRPICRVIEFADKFPNQILEKMQLQRFLGCLNYVVDFFPQLNNLIQPLHERLKKYPPPWTDVHTNIVKQIRQQVKVLPCLYLPNPNLPKIVETDASDIGYGGVLKQRMHNTENCIAFTSQL